MAFFSPGRVAVAGAVVMLAGTFGVAHLAGRTGGPEAEGAPTPSPAPAPDAGAGLEAGAAPDAGGPESQPGSELTAEELAAVRQPITGPGNPPLPHSGSGPFGTRRTTGAGYVALTFDDGPDPRWTPEVLELLREHDIRATFCVVGQLAEAYPELVRDIAADGHTLCNHSWDHDIGLGSRSEAEIRQDLEQTDAAIRAAVPGSRVSYYRQPGGAWTERVVGVAEEMGMSALHWEVDPQDWSEPGASAIASQVSTFTREGSIVLLHDGGGERQGTVGAVRAFLPGLAERLHLDALPPGVDPPRRHGVELPVRAAQR